MKGDANIKNPLSNKRGDTLSVKCAHAIFDICASEGVLLDDSSVNLDVSRSTIQNILDSKISEEYKREYVQNRKEVVDTILFSRYVNMYALLKVRFSAFLIFVSLLVCQRLE